MAIITTVGIIIVSAGVGFFIGYKMIPLYNSLDSVTPLVTNEILKRMNKQPKKEPLTDEDYVQYDNINKKWIKLEPQPQS